MSDEPIVFALSGYSIKRDGTQFFVTKTWGPPRWSKPYGSLQHACNAIARNLQREWVERQARREDFRKRQVKKAEGRVMAHHPKKTTIGAWHSHREPRCDILFICLRAITEHIDFLQVQHQGARSIGCARSTSPRPTSGNSMPRHRRPAAGARLPRARGAWCVGDLCRFSGRPHEPQSRACVARSQSWSAVGCQRPHQGHSPPVQVGARQRHTWREGKSGSRCLLLEGREGGYHSWTPDEVARFEAHHPVGSKARLALALLLYTGQRRSDVVRFGAQHVRDGWLRFAQQKNRNRKPITLALPLLPRCKRSSRQRRSARRPSSSRSTAGR